MRDWEKDLAETEAFRQGRSLGAAILAQRKERAAKKLETPAPGLQLLYTKRPKRAGKGRPGFEDIYNAPDDGPGAA